MATLKLYLDSRTIKDGNPAPLKAAITNKGATTLINLNVKLLPSQWDNRSNKVINHPNKLFLNTYVTKRSLYIETLILKLTESGKIGNMKPSDIKRYIVLETSTESNESDSNNNFFDRFKKFTESKSNERTNEIYTSTLNWKKR